ncbi:DUF6527 family protein [Spirillospora sp. CA-255316]
MRHQFVDHAPESLEAGVLYVSIPFASVLHLCCCGCGREVVTPLTPRDWRLVFDGETVTLEPSIGNWSFPCRSHYWIRRSTIRWAPSWLRDRTNERRSITPQAENPHAEAAFSAPPTAPEPGRLRRFLRKIRRSSGRAGSGGPAP